MTLNRRDEAIRLLATGFSDEFAQMCAADERMHELMMTLSEEFVSTNIPIVDEDNALEDARIDDGFSIRVR